MLFLLSQAHASGWECYQQMMMIDDVTAQSVKSSNGSSMYNSDGNIKTSGYAHTRGNVGSSMYNSDGTLRQAGVSNYESNASSNYHKTATPHYFTICEENGRMISIIEHN